MYWQYHLNSRQNTVQGSSLFDGANFFLNVDTGHYDNGGREEQDSVHADSGQYSGENAAKS
jgi:hypothetical protein